MSTTYLNIYRTVLRQICRAYRTMAVDDDLKLVVRSLKERYRGNLFLALSASIQAIGFA